ncbi:MAG: alpha/beta hydrolase [Pseudomonadota bacterium]
MIDFERRRFLVVTAAGALAAPAFAQDASQPSPKRPSYWPTTPPSPPDSVIPLWPFTPPGGGGRASVQTEPLFSSAVTQNIDAPALGFYRPKAANGDAVVICPGGGYSAQSTTFEGSAPALRLNAEGVTAFVLSYRLPAEGWADRPGVPLQDLQRAIRLVRSRAAEWGVNPSRVGVLGFSAGGHLAATLANRFSEPTYRFVDVVDDQETRPAFAGLIYPVITMMPPYAYAPGVPLLLGDDPTDDLRRSRSNELLVTSGTPPCFIAHGTDDALVPVENSLMMMHALRDKKIPFDAHLFQEGRHGFGLGTPGQPNAEWPDLFVRWLRRL